MLRYIWVTSQAASCRSAPDSVIWSDAKTPSSKTGGHTLGGLWAQVLNSWLHKFSAAEKHHDSGPWFYMGLWRGLWDWECLLIFTLQVYHTPWPSSLSEDLSLVISSLVYLHLTSRNLITTKKQYSSFQKGQTKYTLKVLVQNVLLGNMKSNGNRILKMGSARLTWVMQTGLGKTLRHFGWFFLLSEIKNVTRKWLILCFHISFLYFPVPT